MIEDARGSLDRNRRRYWPTSPSRARAKAGKRPLDQVEDVVAQIEKIEEPLSLQVSTAPVHTENVARCVRGDSVRCGYIVVQNVNEMINTELLILKKWVGNDDLGSANQRRENRPAATASSDEVVLSWIG